MTSLESSSFTPKQVAQALHVSESSVKRWCDRGVIRTDRTLGGHRRIPLEHLLEFLESTNRRLIDPSIINVPDHLKSSAEGAHGSAGSNQASRNLNDVEDSSESAIREHFEKSLVSGNEQECRKAISAWYSLHRSLASVSDDLLAPTFKEVGNHWACGRVDIYQERRGCEICIRLLHELRRLIPDPLASAPLAMGATPSGDQYQIANQLIEMVFREGGWKTTNLGSNVPFDSLLAAVRKYMPKLFWLSVSYIEDVPTFIDQCDRFAQSVPKGMVLVVGGRAIDESIRPKLRFSAYCDNMQQLSALARAIRGNVGLSVPAI